MVKYLVTRDREPCRVIDLNIVKSCDSEDGENTGCHRPPLEETGKLDEDSKEILTKVSNFS